MTPLPLPPIPHLRLRCHLRSAGRAGLPAFKGSMLRGAFGHALRRQVCAAGPRQSCASCPLLSRCDYPRLFEPRIPQPAPPLLRGLETAPRPYLFTAWSPETELAAGSPLRFELILLGQAVELQARAVLAVAAMAGAGLGSRGRGQGQAFHLASVEVTEPSGTVRPLYEEGTLSPRPAAPSFATPSLGPLPGPGEKVPEDRLTLRFLTPTRLHVRGRPISDPDFRTLAGKLLRRTLELAHCHVPEATPGWELRPLLDAASQVRTVRRDLRWETLARYSSRQGRTHSTSGFVGELELAGPLAPWRPLLRTAELIHLGKGTTWGLGRVEVVG